MDFNPALLKQQATLAIDQAAIELAPQSLVIFDCRGSHDRQIAYLEDQALIYSDKLASKGFDLFEAEACGDRLLAAALWCVQCPERLPAEIRRNAISKCSLIYSLSGNATAAVQLSAYSGLTAALDVMDGQQLEKFRQELMTALDSVVSAVAGNA